MRCCCARRVRHRLLIVGPHSPWARWSGQTCTHLWWQLHTATVVTKTSLTHLVITEAQRGELLCTECLQSFRQPFSHHLRR
jgi:hypothetical protein